MSPFDDPKRTWHENLRMLLEHRPKKFVERVARLISSKLVELEVMPKKLDRFLKTWRVEVVICAGIYISLIVGPWPFWRETNFLQASGGSSHRFRPRALSPRVGAGPCGFEHCRGATRPPQLEFPAKKRPVIDRSRGSPALKAMMVAR